MMNVLFIIVMLLPTILSGVFKFWPLFWVFVTFDIIFGIEEFLWDKKTGKTVSQHFWKRSLKEKVKAIAILISWMVMCGALAWHLGYKMF